MDYPQDDRNENDVKEQAVPVAIQSDSMDGIAGTSLGFIPGRYQASGGGAVGAGSWTTAGTDENNSDVGSKHWRHSQPGSNYPSSAYDRLVRGFFTTTQDCGPGAALDGELSYVYQIYACRDAFTRTISSQRSSMSVRGVRPTTVTPSPSRCGAHPANTTTPCSRSTGT